MKPLTSIKVSIPLAVLLLTGTLFAQDGSWVGKSILIKKFPVSATTADELKPGTLVPIIITLPAKGCDPLVVLAEKEGRLKVVLDEEHEMWLDRSAVVLLEDAVGFFSECIKQNPKDAAAFCGRAVAWKLQKQVDKALADFAEALRLEPSWITYYRRAAIWMECDNYDQIIADTTEALRLGPGLDPNNASILNDRGVAWKKKKDLDRAVADYSAAIRQNPKLWLPYYNRGFLFAEKGELDKAFADYNDAIRLFPKQSGIWFERAKVRFSKQDFDQAIVDYTEAFRLDPKNQIGAVNNRGFCLMKKYELNKASAMDKANANYDLLDKAIADFDLVLGKEPDHVSARKNRAISMAVKKEFGKAIADCDIILRQNPKIAVVHYLRAEFNLSGPKQYAEAIGDLQEEIRLNPTLRGTSSASLICYPRAPTTSCAMASGRWN